MCYEKTRNRATMLSVFSIFLILLGIVMIVETALYGIDTTTVLSANMGDITAKLVQFRVATFNSALCFSVITILVGIVGCVVIAICGSTKES